MTWVFVLYYAKSGWLEITSRIYLVMVSTMMHGYEHVYRYQPDINTEIYHFLLKLDTWIHLYNN
jgi:hypothetical protein